MRPLVNTDEPEPVGLYAAGRRVLEVQTKLHRWASDDPHRRFDDLYNLVADPAFLRVAWDRVRDNKGAYGRVDGETAHRDEEAPVQISPAAAGLARRRPQSPRAAHP